MIFINENALLILLYRRRVHVTTLIPDKLLLLFSFFHCILNDANVNNIYLQALWSQLFGICLLCIWNDMFLIELSTLPKFCIFVSVLQKCYVLIYHVFKEQQSLIQIVTIPHNHFGILLCFWYEFNDGTILLQYGTNVNVAFIIIIAENKTL